MRYAILVPVLALFCSASAQAGMLDQSQFDPAQFLPPPPSEAPTQIELAELKAIAARTGAEERAAAARDAKDESPDIFNAAIGFDIAATPQTQKLLAMVVEEEDGDSKIAKAYFHRQRPYSVDPSLKTCEPIKPGKAANSYPSGHSSLAFSMGVVLANLMPAFQAQMAKAQAELRGKV